MKSSIANALEDDPNMIVDDNYLMTHFLLTKSFINQHARAMGSFSKPRRFFLKYVLSHLDELALRSMKKTDGKRVDRSFQNRMVHQIVNETILAPRSRKENI